MNKKTLEQNKKTLERLKQLKNTEKENQKEQIELILKDQKKVRKIERKR